MTALHYNSARTCLDITTGTLPPPQRPPLPTYHLDHPATPRFTYTSKLRAVVAHCHTQFQYRLTCLRTPAVHRLGAFVSITDSERKRGRTLASRTSTRYTFAAAGLQHPALSAMQRVTQVLHLLHSSWAAYTPPVPPLLPLPSACPAYHDAYVSAAVTHLTYRFAHR